MNRMLGIDYGDKRVGVAVSDLLGFGAHGVRTIEHKGLTYLVGEIMKIVSNVMELEELLMKIKLLHQNQ